MLVDIVKDYGMAIKSLKILETIFLATFMVNVVHNAQTLDKNGPNVCRKQVSFIQTHTQSYSFTRKDKYTKKCGLFGWGRCTRYRTVYSTKYRLNARQVYQTVYECCKGWKQVGDKCSQAICAHACVHGACTQPDHCACQAGYHGKLCERDCPPHKWGPHCKHYCLCRNNAKCSPHTGSCYCIPGWEGQYCDKPCDQGYYGNKCQSVCHCQNGAYCDVISGKCTCTPGFRGERCDAPCNTGFYGQNCTFKCSCPQNVVCDHVNGTCNCTYDWTGNKCEGPRSLCDESKCMHGSRCDHVSGTCNCTSGWTDEVCSQKCHQGTYGYRCVQKCGECKHGATCDHVTGACQCTPGYLGDSCQDTCMKGTYGPKCSKKCACQNNATCSPIDGICNCTQGFTGVQCENYDCSEVNSVGEQRLCKEKTQYDAVIGEKRVKYLLPSVFGTVSFIIAALIAIGCFIRCKRSKRMSGKAQTTDTSLTQVTESTECTSHTTPDEGIYQTPYSLPVASFPSRREIGNAVESNHYAEPKSLVEGRARPETNLYENPTTLQQCTSSCDYANVPVVNEKQYMALQSRPQHLDIYEPLSPVTRNGTGPFVDEGEKTKSNDYQELQLTRDNNYQHLSDASTLAQHVKSTDGVGRNA